MIRTCLFILIINIGFLGGIILLNLSVQSVLPDNFWNSINIVDAKVNKKIDIENKFIQIYKIQTNFLRLDIEFIQPTQIHHILISDVLTNLDYFNDENHETEEPICDSTSSFCIKQHELNGDYEFTVGQCVEYVYLHIILFPKEEDSHGQILIQYIEPTAKSFAGCEVHKPKESMELLCANTPKSKCNSYDNFICDNRCQWISCATKRQIENQQAKQYQELFGMCIPNKQIANDYLCLQHADYFQTSPENRQFNFKKCGLPLNMQFNYNVNGDEKGQTIFQTALIIILVVFFLSIIYYRWKINSHRVAPFTPPSFCPNFIYPPVYVNQDQQMETQYRPPATNL